MKKFLTDCFFFADAYKTLVLEAFEEYMTAMQGIDKNTQKAIMPERMIRRRGQSEEEYRQTCVWVDATFVVEFWGPQLAKSPSFGRLIANSSASQWLAR